MNLSCILVRRQKQIVFSVFTYKATSLPALTELLAFLYGIYVFAQYINMVSINQNLVCSIQFESFLNFLDVSGSMF